MDLSNSMAHVILELPNTYPILLLSYIEEAMNKTNIIEN